MKPKKNKMLTSIITGDIINSRSEQMEDWLKVLKSTLKKFGKQPNQWEIFRGDSFQLELSPEDALHVAILIKAHIKQIKSLDVRIAIGIGEKNYSAQKITESNGSAFVNSGDCFDKLKKTTLAIRSPWPLFDEEMNLYLDIAALIMDNWKPITSEIIKIAFENPLLNQAQLSKKYKKTQSAISKSLKRSGYDEIHRLEQRYRMKITQKIKEK